MRERRSYAVYGFSSTHSALDAEALLGDMGIDVVPIPAPATLSALCGIALRLPVEQRVRAEKYLENAGIGQVGSTVIEDW